MARITKIEALNTAINTIDVFSDTIEISTEQQEKLIAVKEILNKMKEQLAKASSTDETKKAEQSQKRKELTAKARAELVGEVSPILKKYLSANPDITAKELYSIAEDELPDDFSAAKVQNVLIRELAPELIRTERKKGGDIYRLKEKAQ